MAKLRLDFDPGAGVMPMLGGVLGALLQCKVAQRGGGHEDEMPIERSWSLYWMNNGLRRIRESAQGAGEWRCGCVSEEGNRGQMVGDRFR